MFYKDWKPLYDKIANDFNFQIEKDIEAANILNKMLQKKNLRSKKKLEDIMTSKFAWVIVGILVIIFLIAAIKVFNPVFHPDLGIASGEGTSMLEQIRGYMVSSSEIISIVTANDIKVGWPKTIDSFPCITITQVGGSDVGLLGYNASVAGSQTRKETTAYQIDVFSKASRLQTLQIADLIVPRMISGGCRKDSDVEDYDDESQTYRKIQTYSKITYFDD